jgi:putative spermidine/putrescine transport system permease protein
MTQASGRKLRAFLLVAPLFCFLALFFVVPLAGIFKLSVSDTSAVRALPRTASVIGNWDGAGHPGPDVFQAFVEDLRASDDEQALGDMVRRLNSIQPGFRTLMAKTTRAASEQAGALDLLDIDRKWSQPAYWEAIATALEPVTDRYLLATVDLKRDSAGSIVEQDANMAVNRAVLFRTLWIGAVVTFFCVLLGYPYALVVAYASRFQRAVLLGAVLLPLWTSLLVRTAAWFLILQEKGLINEWLQAVGLIDGPIALIFNRTGLIIAMTHVQLPLMVLPIYSVLVTIPKNLMPAAASLGAPPLSAFLRVLLPLSARGVASGMLLVFISSLGYYITPALLGGAGEQMLSSFIAFYATSTADWSMASALGLILVAVTVVLYAVYERLSGSSERRT